MASPMPCTLAIEKQTLTAVGRPNDSLGHQGRVRVMLFLSVFAVLVGSAWAVIGAWPVLPFAGLEVACLAGAWWFISHHANDYEYVVMGPGKVAVDVRRGRRVERYDFQPVWTRVVKEQDERGSFRVKLASGGHEVEVGVWLAAGDRLPFADKLAGHLRGLGAVAG